MNRPMFSQTSESDTTEPEVVRPLKLTKSEPRFRGVTNSIHLEISKNFLDYQKKLKQRHKKETRDKAQDLPGRWPFRNCSNGALYAATSHRQKKRLSNPSALDDINFGCVFSYHPRGSYLLCNANHRYQLGFCARDSFTQTKSRGWDESWSFLCA